MGFSLILIEIECLLVSLDVKQTLEEFVDDGSGKIASYIHVALPYQKLKMQRNKECVDQESDKLVWGNHWAIIAIHDTSLKRTLSLLDGIVDDTSNLRQSDH
jgi:hypothetical protein